VCIDWCMAVLQSVAAGPRRRTTGGCCLVFEAVQHASGWMGLLRYSHLMVIRTTNTSAVGNVGDTGRLSPWAVISLGIITLYFTWVRWRRHIHSMSLG
jgi:hypothetical protein